MQEESSFERKQGWELSRAHLAKALYTHPEQAGECQSRDTGSTDNSSILIFLFSPSAAFEKASGQSLTKDLKLS